ncbi:MAG: zinc carboxypeptidase, partial [Gemmatimonadetes bacterium]
MKLLLLRHTTNASRARSRAGARLLLALTAVLLTGPFGAGELLAQQAPPSPEDVLGYGIGERFTDAREVVHYMRTLAAASPRVRVVRYGETYERRPLVQVVLASEANLARLDEILEANAELTDPDTPPARAEAIIADIPAVVYLSYGVHGNESSSSEAAMWTAWDLARGAPEAAGALDSLVVVIDPVVNPDGRDRYVSFYRQAAGPRANPNREAWEHREPWPGGRTNHYFFDLNRDWTWMSQAETRARLETWRRWNPQVHVDFHEMFYNSSYFFFPATPPISPLYPEHILRWGERFGRANAEAFDARGWLYYTAEGFDLFYPGYGDSWPSLTGAIGMTYEQAGHSFAGRAVEREDGTVLTLAERATHHRVTGLTTVRTAAEGRTDLMRGYADFHRRIDEGLSDVLLVPGADPQAAEALVDLLLAQGIEVERAQDGFEVDAAPHEGFGERDRFPAGTYLVRMRQPRGRLAATLLQAEVELDATFSYDISAWSLPYAFGVEAHAVRGRLRGSFTPVEAGLASGDPASPWTDVLEASVAGAPAPAAAAGGAEEARFGYLLPAGLRDAPALVAFLREGGRAYALADTFTLAGRHYAHGAVFLPRGRNDDLEGRVQRAGLAGRVVPVRTGFTEGGPDLGTEGNGILRARRVALLAGEGTSSNSFGAHRFFLERRLGLPFDAVLVSSLPSLDLSVYDVIVVPSGGGVARELGERGRERLLEWVRAGGTLVAVDAG